MNKTFTRSQKRKHGKKYAQRIKPVADRFAEMERMKKIYEQKTQTP
jgi:hypothetical protein